MWEKHNVGNSMKLEENMKYWKQNFLNLYFFQYLKNSCKIQITFHQYQKLYSTPPDMVHVPAKFRENTAMRFWVTVQKLNVTDRQTDERICGLYKWIGSW